MAGRKVKREGQESLGGEGTPGPGGHCFPGLLAWNGRLKR